MSLAVNLPEAAGLALNFLEGQASFNTMRSALLGFFQGTINGFPQATLSNNPISNWFTVMASFATQLPNASFTNTQIQAAAEIVYRLCWMGEYLRLSGGITTVQANLLLDQYNANLSF
jgi:hypothetical protein